MGTDLDGTDHTEIYVMGMLVGDNLEPMVTTGTSLECCNGFALTGLTKNSTGYGPLMVGMLNSSLAPELPRYEWHSLIYGAMMFYLSTVKYLESS